MVQSGGETKIRRMVDADLPKVNEIDSMLFDKERVPTWPFSFAAYWNVYRPELSFVAELDGKVVGFLVGEIRQEEPSWSIFDWAHIVDHPSRHKQVGWIDMIGIHPDCQRKGIGQSLVEAFYEECKRNNASMSCMIKENDERLKSFAEAVGFKKWDIATYEKV